MKLTEKSIRCVDNKYILPLNFGILKSGFIVDLENPKTLKVVLTLKKSEYSQINIDDYNSFQLKYNCLITTKYKIKNSKKTTKILNEFFSYSSNYKFLNEQPINEINTRQENNNDIKPKNTNSILNYKNYVYGYNDEFNNVGLNNLNKTYNDFFPKQNDDDYDNYENIVPFNDFSNACDSIFNNENDTIEEYKKTSETLNEKQLNFYEKKNFFKNKIGLLCEITNELKNIYISNKNVYFQSTLLNNLYFYFTNTENNSFESVRLKYNGKIIFEAEKILLNINNNFDQGLYLIPINTNVSNILCSESIDSYELVFDGLTDNKILEELKFFEISKNLCIYSQNNFSPNLIKM